MNLEKLKQLKMQVDAAMAYAESNGAMRDMTYEEVREWKTATGECDFVIGNFAIREIVPPK